MAVLPLFGKANRTKKPGSDVDLGRPRSFHLIILRWGDAYPEQLRLQTSNDGLHPQHWKDVTGDIAGSKEVQSIPLSRVNARHVRLLIPAAPNAGDRGYLLYSFEVYGDNELPEDTKAPPFVLQTTLSF